MNAAQLFIARVGKFFGFETSEKMTIAQADNEMQKQVGTLEEWKTNTTAQIKAEGETALSDLTEKMETLEKQVSDMKAASADKEAEQAKANEVLQDKVKTLEEAKTTLEASKTSLETEIADLRGSKPGGKGETGGKTTGADNAPEEAFDRTFIGTRRMTIEGKKEE